MNAIAGTLLATVVAATVLTRTDSAGAKEGGNARASDQSAQAVRYVVAPSGNTARYRVREQLVGLDLPNDAVGETNEVSGEIVIGANGRIDPQQSRIVVGVGGLTSDRERRDGYLRNRTLETAQHPTVLLVPTETRGVAVPLPSSGSHRFQLVGNLTVKGVTRPAVWNVSGTFVGDTLTGSAATRFAFSDFELAKPRVSIVLSVADSIGLEYDFRLVRARQ
jgi:polyisoprenoid-binding protein YceI